jgi:hypothetical protein
MGGLSRQVVPVLLKELDQLAPKQSGITGSIDALLNMYAQEGIQGGYEFVPRPGTTAISRPGSVLAGYRLATLGGQLLLFSDSGIWRRTTDGWHPVTDYNGNALTWPNFNSVNSSPIYVEGTAADSCDFAYVNGYYIRASAGPSALSSTFPVVSISVTDANGAKLDTAFRASTGSPVQVRIAVVGTLAVIFWAESTTSTITCVKFNTATATFSATAAITTTASTAGAFNPIFDIQAIPATSKIAVLWNDSATSNLTQTLLTPSTMTVAGTTAYAPKGTNFVTKGYVTNNFATANLVVAYISSATGLHVDWFDSATLATSAGGGVYDAGAVAGASITGYRSGAASAIVYYTVKGALPFDDKVFQSINVGFGSAAFTRGAIASRAFLITNAQPTPPLFLRKYRGVGQATYFLVDGNGIDIARAMTDVAAADPSNALVGLLSLPNLMLGPTSSTYITAGLRSVSLESGAGGITSNTGAASVTVIVNDVAVGSSVELNGVLHVPGAYPSIYDGANVVEEGFPIFPEQSDAYVLAGGGGLTASSTYTYRYVFEWTDLTGAIHRSGPNLIPQQAVLGVGQTKVTHSIPNVIVSRKGIVSVGVYRTVANGDGSTYYKAGSVQILPGAGNPNRFAFVDTVPDATLVAGVPLYTDGNILENLAPPPCMTFAIHRGRILVGGVDGDPTAVWFSKDVAQGFGIAFNDALVSRLNSANEPVTALGSMDSFAAAFTNTSAWSSSDDYPDDTGAGGVLKFAQASSTNGCAGARLLARADDGLTAWQAKTSFVGGPGPGPWRFSRGSAWEWIGQAIQLDAAAIASPRTIFAVPGLNQMRIVGSAGGVNGNVLVRETTFNTWATWTYLVSPSGAPTIVDAIVWGSSVVYLGSDGHVLLENTSLYSDTANAIAHSIVFSPFNFAGVAGYQRIYVGQLTGRILGTAGLGESLQLSIVQNIDGTDMAAKNRTLTPDANALFDGVEFDPGPNGKCSAYQVTISNVAAGPNDSRCAWTLAAVTMEVGIKPNVNRLPPGQRAV